MGVKRKGYAATAERLPFRIAACCRTAFDRLAAQLSGTVFDPPRKKQFASRMFSAILISLWNSTNRARGENGY
jgi:hypothetical protein